MTGMDFLVNHTNETLGIAKLTLLNLVGLVLIGVIVVIALRINSVQDRLESTEQALLSSQKELGTVANDLRNTKDDLIVTNLGLQSAVTDARQTKRDLASTQEILRSTNSELDATKAKLTSTDSELDATKVKLESTDTELNATKAKLTSTDSELDATKVKLESTDTELNATKAKLTSTDSELDATKVKLESTDTELNATKAKLTSTDSELDATKVKLESTTTALDQTNSRIDSVQTELESTSEELTAINTAIGSVEQLREEAAALETDIADLREQREPLILDTHTNSFACTGSMEPKLGCTDSALWLTNYDPADIVLGAFVVFADPRGACEPDYAAHRVIKVRERDGELQFRTKGDNTDEDDGCWLSAEHIRQYMIEFYEDTHPERQWQRAAVNAAKDEYDAAGDEYDAYVESRCRLDRSDDRWECREPYYSRAVKMWQEWNDSWEVYNCWVDVARDWDWWVSSEQPDPLPCESN